MVLGRMSPMTKVALVGYGYWGPNLLRNFYETPNCEVLYCCDKDTSRLKLVRKRYPSVILTSSFTDILKDEEVDAVIIAVPNKLHYKMAKQVIEAGKDVLIEKPMTLTAKEARDLTTTAKRKKRIVMVDHVFLFTQAVRKLKQIIDSGKIGEIVYIDSVRVNLGLFQKDSNVIYDLATHDISILKYLLGKDPNTVSCTGKSYFGRYEEVAYLHLDYPGKMSCHVHVSWLSPLKVRRMMIVGTKKMVVYDDVETSEKIKIYDKGIMVDGLKGAPKKARLVRVGYRSGDIWSPHTDIVEALSVMSKEFVEAVEKRKEHFSNGKFGQSVVNVLEKATISSKQRKAIRLI